jgi:hypothetical protein
VSASVWNLEFGILLLLCLVNMVVYGTQGGEHIVQPGTLFVRAEIITSSSYTE